MSCIASITSVSRPCGNRMGGIRRVGLMAYNFLRSSNNALIFYADDTLSGVYLYSIPDKGVIGLETVVEDIIQTDVDDICSALADFNPDHLVEIDIRRTGASVNSEMVRNEDSGVFYYEHTLAIPLGFISEDAAATLYGLQNAPVLAVAETWDGRLLVLGNEIEGAVLTAATVGTGENCGDTPDTQFTIVARSPYPLPARIAPVQGSVPLSITASEQAKFNETFMAVM